MCKLRVNMVCTWHHARITFHLCFCTIFNSDLWNAEYEPQRSIAPWFDLNCCILMRAHIWNNPEVNIGIRCPNDIKSREFRNRVSAMWSLDIYGSPAAREGMVLGRNPLRKHHICIQRISMSVCTVKWSNFPWGLDALSFIFFSLWNCSNFKTFASM